MHEKQFCVETKRFMLHKKQCDVDKNRLMLQEKVFHDNNNNNKKLMLREKSISCRQKQNATQKKYIALKKVIHLFWNGGAP